MPGDYSKKILCITTILFILSYIHFSRGYCKAFNFSPANKVLVNSIPKSGTHLATRVIEELTGFVGRIIPTNLDDLKSNQFMGAHLPYSVENELLLRKNNVKGVFIFRDPRDQLVSNVFFIYKFPQLWPMVQHLTFDQLLEYLIKDGSLITSLNNIDAFYKSFLPWKEILDIFYTTQFEKLIGPLGGGTLASQLTEIKNIAAHIGISISDGQAMKISQAIYGNTWTFREGKIGSWKKYFNEQHKRLFKHIAGQLLIDLGYETDLLW
jgi:hypothetical protein